VNYLNGAQGSQTYFSFNVPGSASLMGVAIGNGTGNADLYLKFGSDPTLTDYDCVSKNSNNAENCTVNAQAGTYYIMVYGTSAYMNLSIKAAYQ
jgi:serine protease